MYVHLYSVYIMWYVCFYTLYLYSFSKIHKISFLSGNMLPRVQGMEATAAAGWSQVAVVGG